VSLRFIPGDTFSQAVSVVSQSLSVETADRVSADAAELSNRISADGTLSQAISAVSQSLSVETAARIAGDNALSQGLSLLSTAISAVSQQLSLQVSALSQAVSTVSAAVVVVSALATSALGVANGVSNNLSAETVNRVSADAALSTRIDTQSQGLSVLSQQVSALSQQVSAADAALSVRIDTQSQGISVLSQKVSTLSQGLSVVSNALSVETAARIAGDSALSTLISAVSQQLSLQVSALSQVHSALSANVAAISLNLSAVSTAVSVLSDAHTSLVNRVSANSATGGGGSVTSTELSAAVAAETSNRISADDALSVRINTVSDKVSGISQILSTLRGGTTAQVLKKNTATDFDWSWQADVTGGAGSADVTSQKISTLSQNISVVSNALSAETAARISADNALSTLISALSADLSVRMSAMSQVHSALSANVATISTNVSAISTRLSALSAQLSTDISAISQAHSALSQAVSVADAALSVRINTQSQAISVLSQQVSALSANVAGISLNVSAISTALSVETAARVAADNALSTLISALSADLSVRMSAMSQAHSALSQTNSAEHAALSVRIDTQSQGISVLSQQVSALSANVAAISLTVSALSTQISAAQYMLLQNNFTSALDAGTPVYAFTSANTFSRAFAAGTIQQRQVIGLIADGSIAISATGRIQYHGLLSLTSAQWNAQTSVTTGLTPGDIYYLNDTAPFFTTAPAAGPTRTLGVALTPNVLRLQISDEDGTLSLTQAEISNRISADNALSQQISVLSASHLSLVSAVSALSAAHLSLVSAVSAVSAAVAAETSNRISADNALSTVISALGTLSIQNVDSVVVSAGTPIYAFTSAGTFKRANASAAGTRFVIGLVEDGSVAVSASGRVRFGGVINLTTGQWDAITGGAGGLTPGTTYYLGLAPGTLTDTAPTTGFVRVVGVALSSTSLKLQIGNTDDDQSAISALSQQISVLSGKVSGISAIISTLRGGTTAQVLKKNTNVDFDWSWQADVTGGAGSADVTSQKISTLSQNISVVSNALSAETAARISADNALSNLISALSADLSVRMSAMSQAHSVLSAAHVSLVDRVSANSAAGTASVTSAELASAVSNLVSADNALSTLISALSADMSVRFSAISQVHSALSANVAAISLNVSALSTQISALSADLSVRMSAMSQVHSALSVNVAALSTTLSAHSTAISGFSHLFSTMRGGLSGQVLKKNSDGDFSWVWSADNTGAGGGSVTSDEVSVAIGVETADRISADNALSNLISALSADVSLRTSALSQVISAEIVDRISGDNALSAAIDLISTGLGGIQLRVVTGGGAITGSAVTNISGMSISVAADGVYQIEAQVLYKMSVISSVGIGFGLSYPAMSAAQGMWEGEFGSINAPMMVFNATSTMSWVGGVGQFRRVNWHESAANAQTNVILISGIPGTSAGRTYRAKMEGLFNVGTAGTLQVVTKQVVTNGIVIIRGSYIRAYKIL
jgi:trimeric autotransporter adhesin